MYLTKVNIQVYLAPMVNNIQYILQEKTPQFTLIEKY